MIVHTAPEEMETSSSGDDSFASYGSSSHCEDSSPFGAVIKTDGEACFGCGNNITDRYLLKVNSRTWHASCLRCCVCETNLDRQTSCFIREDNIYCKLDYAREFGTKCSKCLRHIQSTDWVRRAKDHVYHLACFACDSCKRQLSTGEEFALQENKLLCKTHYIETIEGGNHSDDGGSQKQKTKRVRTTFSEEQLQVLQANFQLDSNPDGQDLERIAQITGLSKRVTQVWFQNSRARQKKHQHQSLDGTKLAHYDPNCSSPPPICSVTTSPCSAATSLHSPTSAAAAAAALNSVVSSLHQHNHNHNANMMHTDVTMIHGDVSMIHSDISMMQSDMSGAAYSDLSISMTTSMSATPSPDSGVDNVYV